MAIMIKVFCVRAGEEECEEGNKCHEVLEMRVNRWLQTKGDAIMVKSMYQSEVGFYAGSAGDGYGGHLTFTVVYAPKKRRRP